MSFSTEEWTMAFLASRSERDRLLAELERRRVKLSLPLTPARKRVRPRHEAAILRLQEELAVAETRLFVRSRILTSAGIPDGSDDSVAASAIALLRFQAEHLDYDTYHLTAEEKKTALERAERLREKLERQYIRHQDEARHDN